MFAGYNCWANERIYRAAAALSPADFTADHAAFFGSLAGTLNHLLVTDRIWMRRFTGDGPVQTRLDEILSLDIAELTALRGAEDERIIDYVDALTEVDLAGMVTYRTITAPSEIRQPLATGLAHFFNHQTHHRGQATALFTRIGGRAAVESLDLLLFQRATGIGMG
jgi:uncharacterized damage-inducible protein DinB